ncbi:MAG: TolC family protein, partial [Steroidobacteraceae bacterium]|nr:TolC family protein [Steroidobacteraceae bacterium]
MRMTAHARSALERTVSRRLRDGLIALTVVLPVAVATARAADLWDVYQLALKNDPTFAEAGANYRAALENAPIARAGYLPNISASGQRQIDKSSGQIPLTFDPTTNAYIEGSGRFRSYTTGYTVQLTQPIFNWSAWQSIRQADASVAQAQALFVAAQQDLILRTASAYFAVITARDSMAADHAATDAYRRELNQAEARYKVGTGTIIDVQNARAAYDQALATEIAAHQQIINAEEALRAITGAPVGTLQEPVDGIALHEPDPANGVRWVDTALEQNPSLRAARAAADVASRKVAINRGDYYPSLNLVLSHTHNSNNQYSAIQGFDIGQSQSLNGNNIALQLTVPIYEGGAV